MTNLDHIREAIQQYKLSSAKKQRILYAYIQLHVKHPGLHPDDHAYDDSGYEGWMAILTNYVLTNFKQLPDNFQYPTCFLLLPAVLNELKEFHADQLEDDPMDIQTQDLCDAVIEIEEHLSEGKTTTLNGIIDNLIKLHLYHVSENDTDEDANHASTLRDCADVLIWVTQQH